MKTKKDCIDCAKSGKVMGCGMMQKDCDKCDGTGKIIHIEDDIDFLDGKYSESYSKAINEIQALDPNLTKEKAKEIFNDELKKIKKSKRN